MMITISRKHLTVLAEIVQKEQILHANGIDHIETLVTIGELFEIECKMRQAATRKDVTFISIGKE